MKLKTKFVLITLCFLSFTATIKAQRTNSGEQEKTEEKLPHFPGGDNAFYDYLEENVELPQNFDKAAFFKKTGNQYVPVSVVFTIDVDGSVVDVKVVEKVNDLLDEKAIEIVQHMPKWEAGTKDGKPVKVQYAIPIRFNLL